MRLLTETIFCCIREFLKFRRLSFVTGNLHAAYRLCMRGLTPCGFHARFFLWSRCSLRISRYYRSSFLNYKQNNGRINKSGNKRGTMKRDKPQVQVLPTMAVIMMVKTVKLTIKQPPRFRYWTKMVVPLFHIMDCPW
jgi:hypothetical protein